MCLYLGLLTGSSNLPAESPIKNLHKDAKCTPTSPSKPASYNTTSNVTQRRRTLSDYRTAVNSSVTVDTNSGVKAASSIKNATKSLATGLSKFTAKRMVI